VSSARGMASSEGKASRPCQVPLRGRSIQPIVVVKRKKARAIEPLGPRQRAFRVPDVITVYFLAVADLNVDGSRFRHFLLGQCNGQNTVFIIGLHLVGIDGVR
jgi:hypothetical protein